jgi:hypothetical protein
MSFENFKSVGLAPTRVVDSSDGVRELSLEQMDRALKEPRTGHLASYTVEGATVGAITGGINAWDAFWSTPGLRLTNPTVLRQAMDAAMIHELRGLAKSAGVATAVAGFDMYLQNHLGHKILGHDIFRPTGLEMLGIGFAASGKMDSKCRLGLAATSWLIGRIENIFDA